MSILIGIVIGVILTLIVLAIYSGSNLDLDFDFGDLGNGGKMR